MYLPLLVAVPQLSIIIAFAFRFRLIQVVYRLKVLKKIYLLDNMDLKNSANNSYVQEDMVKIIMGNFPIRCYAFTEFEIQTTTLLTFVVDILLTHLSF